MSEVCIVFGAGVMALLPFGIKAMLSYDRLARRMHDSFPEEWRNAGGPIGFLWRPPTGVSPGSLQSFLKTSMVWPFRMPPILAHDPGSKRDRAMLRFCLVVWNVGVIALLGFLSARYGFPMGDR